MVDGTFACPDLTTFARLNELGLTVVGQRLDPTRAVLACRVVEPDSWCRRCGYEGSPRDSVTRRLAHEPPGWRPTVLLVTLRRYRCSGCGHVWHQDTSKAAEPRAKLSRRGVLFEGRAARRFPAWSGKRSFSGWYWCRTTGSMVPFESLLEREAVVVFDFDPSVVEIVAQPFALLWPPLQDGAA